jgi:hypothetical protein
MAGSFASLVRSFGRKRCPATVIRYWFLNVTFSTLTLSLL